MVLTPGEHNRLNTTAMCMIQTRIHKPSIRTLATKISLTGPWATPSNPL